MTNTIYTLIREEYGDDSLDYTLIESSFDKDTLEEKADELNQEYSRRCSLWTKILEETKRRFNNQGGSWSIHQSAVIKELASNETHNLNDFGPHHIVVDTPLV